MAGWVGVETCESVGVCVHNWLAIYLNIGTQLETQCQLECQGSEIKRNRDGEKQAAAKKEFFSCRQGGLFLGHQGVRRYRG